MELHLRFDQTDPPTGRLQRISTPDASPDGTLGPLPFSGWLGLLRVLSEVLSDTNGDPPLRP